MDGIDLKEVVKLCIETFDSEEASSRIVEYINNALEIKEKQVEANFLFAQKLKDIVKSKQNTTLD